jgi:hypothetical protein
MLFNNDWASLGDGNQRILQLIQQTASVALDISATAETSANVFVVDKKQPTLFQKQKAWLVVNHAQTTILQDDAGCSLPTAYRDE